MCCMNKVDVFNKELSYIKSNKYKEAAKIMINLLPDYFFEVPAASTGKYHPACCLGNGGLVRHTKVAVRVAFEFYNDEAITGIFKSEEKDLMLVGLILHDGLKSGLQKSEYTLAEHPKLMADYIQDHKGDLNLTDNEIEFLTNVIISHMGPWNTDYKGNEILPKPVNKYQKFVHMCDYLASRKFLNVDFENEQIVG